MSTAAERLRLITEHLQSESSTLELAQSINAYLAGQGTLDDVRATLKVHEQRRIYAPIYPAWQEAAKLLSEEESSGPLGELDLRCVAVGTALVPSPDMLNLLGTSERKQQALEFLRQNRFAPRTLLMGAILTVNHAFEENNRLTPFGEYLLSFVPETIDTVMAQYSPDHQVWRWLHQQKYVRLLRLLLAANPPDLGHAWVIARQAAEHELPVFEPDDCMELLLQADPTGATVWAREVASNQKYHPHMRQAALFALMRRDPASHRDLADEIIQKGLPPSRPRGHDHLYWIALKEAYHFDQMKYLPQMEEMALGTHWLAWSALEELCKSTGDEARAILQRCVTESAPRAASALQGLLDQDWLGKPDFLLSLIAHRDRDTRDSARTWLAAQGDASVERLALLLADRSAAIRLAAAQTLGQIGTELAAVLLAARLDNEKSAKIRQAIAVILDDLRAADHRTLSREAVLEKAEWLHSYAPQPALDWFNPEEAPALHWTTGTLAPPVVLGYLLHRQLRPHPPGTLEDYARRMLALLDHNTSGDLALALFNGWLNNSARAKDIRVVPLACALGDDRLVALLQHTVESWQKGKEFTLSLNILQAMPLIEAPTLQSTLKDLAKRLRRLKLKRAAKDALAAVTP